MDLFANLIPLDGNGIIDIFGFKFHTDELLILAILFFLYRENVNDTFLYIFLLLLLMP